MAEYIDKRAIRDALYDADAITMKGVELLNKFPVADVVDVVRCKDCKYAPKGDGHGFAPEWPYQELYKCPFMCEDGWYSRKPSKNFFCANGERREG